MQHLSKSVSNRKQTSQVSKKAHAGHLARAGIYYSNLELDSKITNLQSQVNSLNGTIESLNATISSLNSQINSLNATLVSLQEMLRGQNSTTNVQPASTYFAISDQAAIYEPRARYMRSCGFSVIYYEEEQRDSIYFWLARANFDLSFFLQFFSLFCANVLSSEVDY